jgi:small subunit ribosomal protein S16
VVKIRLMRVGKTKQPSYRVVVADQRSPRDGRIIEAIGHYNPRHESSIVSIDTDRAVYWLGVGAQPSDQVRKLLQISGAWAVFKGEAPPAAAAAEAPAAKARKATPASSVKVTPAASIEDEPDEAPSPEAEPATEDAE